MLRLLGTFSFLVVLLRAAILCFQSVAAGGIVFLIAVTRGAELRSGELLRPSWKLIRWSALGLAVSQLLFVAANSVVLTYTTGIPLPEVLGANFVLAGVLAITAALVLAFWPRRRQTSGQQIALVPAGVMIAASVITSHAASRMEDR